MAAAHSSQEASNEAAYQGGDALKIIIASANLGNAQVENLTPWLPQGAPNTDVVVFGLQESTYSLKAETEIPEGDDEVDEEVEAGVLARDEAMTCLHSMSVRLEESEDDVDDQKALVEALSIKAEQEKDQADTFASGDKHLLGTIKAHVGPEFVLLKSVRRWQMRIRVYVRAAIAHEFTEVECGAENTGIAGVIANKGGQAVKFKFRNTTVAFVSSHLAAHEGKVSVRNANIVEILKGIRFGDKRMDMTQLDHVFWFGDLNYRIDPSDVTDKFAWVMERIEKRDWQSLWEADELQKQISEKVVFTGFRTPFCDFAPTFKVNRIEGTEYNTKRTPSYTDRMLVHSLPHVHKNVQVHQYMGCHDFTTSDHKPLFSRLTLKPTEMPTIDASAKLVPQLKFTRLSGRELARVDEGVTWQPKKRQDLTPLSERPEPVSLEKVQWTFDSAKSDPYIVFQALPSTLYSPSGPPNRKEEIRSDVIKQSVDPDWITSRILPLFASTRDQLIRGSVNLLVMDQDMVTQDDLMGVVKIDIQEIVDAAAASDNGTYQFKRDVVRYSVKRGELSGTIEVTIPDEDGKFPQPEKVLSLREVRARNSRGVSAGCGCTIM